MCPLSCATARCVRPAPARRVARTWWCWAGGSSSPRPRSSASSPTASTRRWRLRSSSKEASRPFTTNVVWGAGCGVWHVVVKCAAKCNACVCTYVCHRILGLSNDGAFVPCLWFVGNGMGAGGMRCMRAGVRCAVCGVRCAVSEGAGAGVCKVVFVPTDSECSRHNCPVRPDSIADNFRSHKPKSGDGTPLMTSRDRAIVVGVVSVTVHVWSPSQCTCGLRHSARVVSVTVHVWSPSQCTCGLRMYRHSARVVSACTVTVHVVVAVEKSEYVFAAGCAVARALPLYCTKTRRPRAEAEAEAEAEEGKERAGGGQAVTVDFVSADGKTDFDYARLQRAAVASPRAVSCRVSCVVYRVVSCLCVVCCVSCRVLCVVSCRVSCRVVCCVSTPLLLTVPCLPPFARVLCPPLSGRARRSGRHPPDGAVGGHAHQRTPHRPLRADRQSHHRAPQCAHHCHPGEGTALTHHPHPHPHPHPPRSLLSPLAPPPSFSSLSSRPSNAPPSSVWCVPSTRATVRKGHLRNRA